MLRISQEADYAIRIVGYLSKFGEEGKCDAKTVATSVSVPQRFAVKILRKLNIAGITKSYRGASGGYAVNKNPEGISFLDVVECIDGVVCINKCVHDESKCSDHRDACYGRKTLIELNNVIREILKSKDFSGFN